VTGQELRLKTPWIEIGALAFGPEDAPPTLALHGWLDNAASFIPMAPFLSDRRLVALDLSGHGASGHRAPGANYYFADYVPDMLAAADALGWDTFDLIGHSLGGAVATVLTAVAPDRVKKLALIESLGPVVRDPAKAPDNLIESIEQMKRASLRVKRTYKDAEVAVKARFGVGDISEESARLLVMRNMIEVDDGYQWRSDPRLRQRSPVSFTEDQVMAFVKRIKCPTLLVRGTESEFADREWICPGSHTRRYARAPSFAYGNP